MHWYPPQAYKVEISTLGSIDGYSRTILYLCCADNNRASTTLAFLVQFMPMVCHNASY